jgi:SAM-dependent methyltransferase
MRLEPDGERMVVELYHDTPSDYLIYLFHEVSYRFAMPLVAGRDVLDLGCGSGYGSAMLAEAAARVVGVDVSAAAVEHARTRFSRGNTTYRQISPDGGLPFEDREFDCVVCFQVIEHVKDDRRFVSEIARVLRPGGVAILATPDRSTRLLPGQKPWNRWHLREYSAAGLSHVLTTAFQDVSMRYMSGAPGVIDIELRRAARLRWLTIPFTLPIVPEALRFWGLSALRRLNERRKAKAALSTDFGFNAGDLWIGEEAARSVNLVAVARAPLA